MTRPSTQDQFNKASNRNDGKQKPKYPPPFSIRLTWEERAYLERVCGSTPWSTYIRKVALGGAETRRTRKHRQPRADDAALSRALGALGKSRLGSNLNQIAKAANRGTLPITPELLEELNAACAEFRALRSAIIEALGLKAVE